MWQFLLFTHNVSTMNRNWRSSETGSIVLKLDQNQSNVNSLWVLHHRSVLFQVWFCSSDAGGLDLNNESQSGGSDPDSAALDLGMDGKKDCIFNLNSDNWGNTNRIRSRTSRSGSVHIWFRWQLTLWTSISFHTVVPMSPTPHQAHRDPHPSALRARDAPDSGTAAVAATPCNNSQSGHQIRSEQGVKGTPTWSWTNEAKFTEKNWKLQK